MQRNVETTPPGEAGGGEGDEGVEAGVEGEEVEAGVEGEGMEAGVEGEGMEGEGGVAGEEVRRNWLALQEHVITCHTHTHAHTHTHTRYRRCQVVWQHTRVQNDV